MLMAISLRREHGGDMKLKVPRRLESSIRVAQVHPLYSHHSLSTTITSNTHFTQSKNTNSRTTLEMYALTLLIAALGMVAAAPSNDFEARQLPTVASVDRYSGSGCTGTICN